jgi:outer membrane biosynthesis protein TonB
MSKNKNRTKIFLAIWLAAAVLAAAKVEAGEEATAKGSLDKAVIRNVIQQQIHQVKKCYETELEKNQNLAGRVVVHFIIGDDGKVVESRIEETTLHSPGGEQCIANAVRGWAFSKPRGGKVVVRYPFVLAASEPAGDSKQ